MWKAPASVICGCLAALPLIGCAGDVATSGQATAVVPAATTEPEPYYAPAPRVYAVGAAAPAAVLVLWPGDDTLARDPALWTAQGFDVVVPQPADIYRLVTDQQAALARLVASAHALADAPIWVVGPGSVIDAALTQPQFERGVSGVVMTSVTSGAGSCSESFFYSDPGTGAPPKVEVKRSGDCGTGMPAIGGRQPSVLPTPSAPRPNQPRLIEASAVGKNLPPAA
ncbi:MAG TPA: hypothetical protein VGN21_06085, partial [Stellaceae bacterium]